VWLISTYLLALLLSSLDLVNDSNDLSLDIWRNLGETLVEQLLHLGPSLHKCTINLFLLPFVDQWNNEQNVQQGISRVQTFNLLSNDANQLDDNNELNGLQQILAHEDINVARNQRVEFLNNSMNVWLKQFLADLEVSQWQHNASRSVLDDSCKHNVQEENDNLNLDDSTNECDHTELISSQEQIDSLDQEEQDTRDKQVSPQEDVKE